MMIMMLIFPLLLIVVVAVTIGWRPQLNLTGLDQIDQNPLEILKARYARGELSQVEYEEMRRDLEG